MAPFDRSEVLDQKEVDELLGVLGNEMVEAELPNQHTPTGAQTTPTGAQTYKVGLEERIVRKRMPAMETINEHFTRSFKSNIFHFMRQPLEVTYEQMKVVQYASFSHNIALPASISVIHIHPLRGTALIVIDAQLIFLLIDSLFGGNGSLQTKVEGREFTYTENRIIQRILEVIFESYLNAWKPIHVISLEKVRSETNFRFINVATPNEVVLWSSFRVDLPHGTGLVHICIPYTMVEPIRDVLYKAPSSVSKRDPHWAKLLSSQLQAADVGLCVTLATKKMNLGEVVKLKKGDIIPIDLAQEVPVKIKGITLMVAKYGTFNGHYALKVQKMLNPAKQQ